jgi:hypothetical protein
LARPIVRFAMRYRYGTMFRPRLFHAADAILFNGLAPFPN